MNVDESIVKLVGLLAARTAILEYRVARLEGKDKEQAMKKFTSSLAIVKPLMDLAGEGRFEKMKEEITQMFHELSPPEQPE